MGAHNNIKKASRKEGRWGLGGGREGLLQILQNTTKLNKKRSFYRKKKIEFLIFVVELGDNSSAFLLI